MFGLFRPRCPINIREKTWIELRMQWLIDRLGFDALQRVEVITPSDTFFPEAYNGSEQDLRRLFHQVCGYLQAPHERIELKFFTQGRRDEMPSALKQGAAGLFERSEADGGKSTIWLEQSSAADPMKVIATLAHELSHHVLLEGRWLTGEETDHEFVTDLFPAVRGLGLFPANAVLAESSYSDGQYHAWQISRLGYLPGRMHGYALAILAWLRNERQPDWARHARTDVRHVLQNGLRYLVATDDCLCRPMGGNTHRELWQVDRLATRLRSEIAGERVAAMWQIRRPDCPPLRAEESTALADCLSHKDPVERIEAARAVAARGDDDPAIAELLIDGLADSGTTDESRIALALALGTQPSSGENAVPALMHLLDAARGSVVNAAVVALGAFGPAAAPAIPRIVGQLKFALAMHEDDLAADAARALQQIGSSVDGILEDYLRDLDRDEYRRANVALRNVEERDHSSYVQLASNDSLPVPV